MKDYPWFKWYAKNAETDEFYLSLTDEECGFFHRCLNRSWINEGIPRDLDALAKQFGRTRENIGQLWVAVGPGWTVSTKNENRLVNHKQEEIRADMLSKSENNKRVGNTNASRHKRVRVSNANKTRSKRVSNASIRASVSSSVSLSSSEDCNTTTPDIKPGAMQLQEWFEEFWDGWPKSRRVGKGAAEKSFCKSADSAERFQAIMTGLLDILPTWETIDPRYIPHPTTWLNQRRWEDEPEQPQLSLNGTGY